MQTRAMRNRASRGMTVISHPNDQELAVLTSIISKSSVTRCPGGAIIFHVQSSSLLYGFG